MSFELSEMLTISLENKPRKLFKSSNDFSLHIEHIAIVDGISCYNALLNWCEENDIDVDDVASSINKQLKEKLAVEFADMGLLQKNASLENI